ncbi:hypothetical protein [Aliterella atlantica]|nr:hypothetical protein [Aliterella atlantica]
MASLPKRSPQLIYIAVLKHQFQMPIPSATCAVDSKQLGCNDSKRQP